MRLPSSLVSTTDKPSDTLLDYLLRVPKAGTKAHKYVELQEYWETAVKGLFRPEDLVQQRLIRLEGEEELASRLNHVLEQEEESRRADYRGSRVAAVEYGMLVEDMRKSTSALYHPLLSVVT